MTTKYIDQGEYQQSNVKPHAGLAEAVVEVGGAEKHPVPFYAVNSPGVPVEKSRQCPAARHQSQGGKEHPPVPLPVEKQHAHQGAAQKKKAVDIILDQVKVRR